LLRRLIAFATAILAAGLAAAAAAQPVTVDGITFSDRLGGFVLRAAGGHGTLDDPFTVLEEVTGGDSPILVIEGMSTTVRNRVGTQHASGFALRKVVVNRTDFVWQSYNLELRETEDAHSPFSDGLSFGQASEVGRPFRSDMFRRGTIADEPLDTVVFSDGAVHPGESVQFDMIITDTSPVPRIYLLQTPDRPVARR
jgi:hypothetical protein